MRNTYIIGNWKMNNDHDQTLEFIKNFNDYDLDKTNKVGICIPSINLFIAKTNNKQDIFIGAENCSHEENGALTGEISLEMLKNIKINYVIVGHSERRNIFNETDLIINKKLRATLEHGLTPIFCFGETLEVYESGHTLKYIITQIASNLEGVINSDIKKIIFAYEPIWAIGTGKIATPEIAQKTIKFVRNYLSSIYGNEIAQKVHILYGGSVKPENIDLILKNEDIDGVLVGGASVHHDQFIKLVNYKQ